MPVIEIKCKICGAPMETFKELGEWAAACTNGDCIGAFEYETYPTKNMLWSALESAPENMIN